VHPQIQKENMTTNLRIKTNWFSDY